MENEVPSEEKLLDEVVKNFDIFTAPPKLLSKSDIVLSYINKAPLYTAQPNEEYLKNFDTFAQKKVKANTDEIEEYNYFKREKIEIIDALIEAFQEELDTANRIVNGKQPPDLSKMVSPIHNTPADVNIENRDDDVAISTAVTPSDGKIDLEKLSDKITLYRQYLEIVENKRVQLAAAEPQEKEKTHIVACKARLLEKPLNLLEHTLMERIRGLDDIPALKPIDANDIVVTPHDPQEEWELSTKTHRCTQKPMIMSMDRVVPIPDELPRRRIFKSGQSVELSDSQKKSSRIPSARIR